MQSCQSNDSPMAEGGLFNIYGRHEECREYNQVTEDDRYLICQTCCYGYMVCDEKGNFLEKPIQLTLAEINNHR